MSLRLNVLPGLFAVCRLPPNEEIPRWAKGAVVSICRSADELSVICEQQDVPLSTLHSRDWACLMLVGPFPLDAVGVLDSVLRPLAAAGINIMAFSSYDTDYLLVPEMRLERSKDVLRAAGFSVI
ncbi:MAG TPA: ACT domain-containing protein [Methanomassiliicoccales archaeon]|nr:ACT domain-containing protein [Methanomassiliicoccales archaeon]